MVKIFNDTWTAYLAYQIRAIKNIISVEMIDNSIEYFQKE